MSHLMQEVLSELKQVPTIIGNSKQVARARYFAEQVAGVTYPVLLLGEPGTGKDRVAKAIHEHSKSAERNGQFVKVNCAAITDTLFESELFGHVRGAFTGAVNEGQGLFGAAQDGTIFLNEIAEISPNLQAKLLEVLEDRKYRRVGKTTKEVTTARVIAATNVDVKDAVAKGKLRSDLLYRLNTFSFTMPPLREHKEDIPELVDYFLKRVDSTKNRKMAQEAVRAMMQYDWPGNVRELKSAVIRASVHANDTSEIGVEHLEPHLGENSRGPEEEKPEEKPNLFSGPLPTFEELKRLYFTEAFRQAGRNQDKAGEIAGMHGMNFRHYRRKYRLDEILDEKKHD